MFCLAWHQECTIVLTETAGVAFWGLDQRFETADF
jgi:hypothetical protein